MPDAVAGLTVVGSLRCQQDRQLDAAEHLKGTAYHEAGHAVVAYLLVERTYSLSRPPSVPLRQR
jgi:hypothetical protein